MFFSSIAVFYLSIIMAFTLYANSNIMVIGATSTGKTTAVLQIIKKQLINPMPRKIFYLYGAKQPFMRTWNSIKGNPQIQFIEGLQLDVIESCDEPKLLIIDDLMMEQNKELAQHFIAGSHHKNTTTIYITHSIFLNNENYRLVSNNCQYMILMKNKRNYAQVKQLARQVLMEGYYRVVEAYKYIGSYGFVMLSFHPKVPEELLVTADYFEKCPSVFL